MAVALGGNQKMYIISRNDYCLRVLANDEFGCHCARWWHTSWAKREIGVISLHELIAHSLRSERFGSKMAGRVQAPEPAYTSAKPCGTLGGNHV